MTASSGISLSCCLFRIAPIRINNGATRGTRPEKLKSEIRGRIPKIRKIIPNTNGKVERLRSFLRLKAMTPKTKTTIEITTIRIPIPAPRVRNKLEKPGSSLNSLEFDTTLQNHVPATAKRIPTRMPKLAPIIVNIEPMAINTPPLAFCIQTPPLCSLHLRFATLVRVYGKTSSY